VVCQKWSPMKGLSKDRTQRRRARGESTERGAFPPMDVVSHKSLFSNKEGRNGAPERTGLNDPGESANADIALEFRCAKLQP